MDISFLPKDIIGIIEENVFKDNNLSIKERINLSLVSKQKYNVLIKDFYDDKKFLISQTLNSLKKSGTIITESSKYIKKRK